MADSKTPPEWTKKYPAPKAKTDVVSVDGLMDLFDAMDLEAVGGRKFLCVDVRRDDWVGGTIRTSINLPAQSFYQSRKTLLDLCQRAGIDKVIFYCGSSSGRGPRCASWFQDYIDDVAKFMPRPNVKVFVLKGGIKGWVKEFQGAMMDGFEEEQWKEQLEQ